MIWVPYTKVIRVHNYKLLVDDSKPTWSLMLIKAVDVLRINMHASCKILGCCFGWDVRFDAIYFDVIESGILDIVWLRIWDTSHESEGFFYNKLKLKFRGYCVHGLYPHICPSISDKTTDPDTFNNPMTKPMMRIIHVMQLIVHMSQFSP